MDMWSAIVVLGLVGMLVGLKGYALWLEHQGVPSQDSRSRSDFMRWDITYKEPEDK